MARDPGSFFERAIAVVRRIPYGEVTTYGQVARLVSGSVRGARAVGYALAALSEAQAAEVPWWRVINAQGRISNSNQRLHAAQQRARLEAEGVCFDGEERVDLARFGWDGAELRWSEEHTDG